MPQTALHFTLLLYPFRHDLFGGRADGRLRRLSARWRPWWSRLVEGEDSTRLRRALDDSYFFMPPVCKLLFPEITCLRPGGDSRELEREVEEARRLAALDLDQLAARLRPGGMLRLTCDRATLSALDRLELRFGDDFRAPVALRWVDVALFPQRVGFLILKVQLDEPQPTTDRLNDFLYHLRFVHPPKIGWRLAEWRLVGAGGTHTFGNQELIEFLLQGIADGHDDPAPSLDDYLSRPADDRSRRFSTTAEGQVFGQSLREYTFACLAATPAPAAVGSRLFDSPAQQAVYELATCTQVSEPDYEPHHDGLKQITEKGRIALWANWEGLALHDNVVFLGVTDTRFTREGLAENVENDYFYLYLLALYQKIRLSLLTGELLRYSEDLYRNLRDARAMVDGFVRFRNHYWFSHVTFKPQGTTIYEQFQRGLDVKSLYDSVSREVSELQDYYEKKAERRRDTLLFFLTFVGLPAGLLSQIFGGVVFGGAELKANPRAWATLGVVSLVTYALSGLIYFAWKRYGR